MLPKLTITGASGLLAVLLLLPASAHAQNELADDTTDPLVSMDVSLWVPAAGDVFIADTKENRGYLAHADGSFLSFRIATGRQSVVNYMGRTYDAATPEDHWVALKEEVQGNRVVFDTDGIFFRLTRNGDEQTAYGIHSYRYIDKMLKMKDRYKSMGCILVNRAIRSLVEKTFKLNGDRLDVYSMYGLGHWNGAAISMTDRA